MPVREAQEAEYRSRFEVYERFASQVAHLIGLACRQDDVVRVHSLDHRAKPVESFVEKLSRPGKAYTHPLTEMTDLAGVRIVLYELGDVKRVESLVGDLLKVDPANSVRLGKRHAANEFGYESCHLVCSLPEPRRALAEWKPYEGMSCEIQIRTVLQHAWASVSHAYQYKRDADVPEVLRRRLFRVAGLLELADEEFQAIEEGHRVLRQDADASARSDPGWNPPIDVTTVGPALANATRLPRVTELAIAAGFEVIEAPGGSRAIPDLVALADLAGLETVADLTALLEVSDELVAEYFAALMSDSGNWSVSPPFVALLILVLDRADSFSVTDLVHIGWHERIAGRVVRIARSCAPDPR